MAKKPDTNTGGKSTDELQKEFDMLVNQIKTLADELKDPELRKEIMNKLSKILAETKDEIVQAIEKLKILLAELAEKAGISIDTDQMLKSAEGVKKEIEKLAIEAGTAIKNVGDSELAKKIAEEVKNSVKENTEAAAERLKQLIEDCKKKQP